jgi:peptidoglycan/LPS O-acetylase OafA/YrhL
MNSVGDRLLANKGHGSGFDFLRLSLAICVLLSHCAQIYMGNESLLLESRLWLFHYAILPMFFALSGFLITASAFRNSIRDFVLHRALRIVPALAVEICLSALILGPILTTHTLAEYYSSAKTLFYFTNIFGWVHYQLPGVFESNPLEGIVNGSIWTIPHEIACYVIIVLLMSVGALKKPVLLVFFAAAMLAIAGLARITLGKAGLQDLVGPSMSDILSQATRLLPYFVLGCAAYLYRHFIPLSRSLFLACIVCLTAVSLLVEHSAGQSPLFSLAVAPLLIYLTIYIGLSDLPRVPLYSNGDYSYGIYLYGFPIQQTVMHLSRGHITPVNFVLASVVLTSLFAAFSWHVVEKPLLRLRRYVVSSGTRVSPSSPPVTAS